MQICYQYSVISVILLTLVNAVIGRLRNSEYDTDTNSLQKYYISQSSDVEEPDYFSNTFFLTTSRFGNIEEALLRERNKDILEHYSSNPFTDSVKVIRHPGPHNKDIISLEIHSNAADILPLPDELIRNKRSADVIEEHMKQMDITDNPDLLVALFINILKNKYPEKIKDMREVLTRIISKNDTITNNNNSFNKKNETISSINLTEQYQQNITTSKNYSLNEKIETTTTTRVNSYRRVNDENLDDDDGNYDENYEYEDEEMTMKTNWQNNRKENSTVASIGTVSVIADENLNLSWKIEKANSLNGPTPSIIIINSTLNVNDSEGGHRTLIEGNLTQKEDGKDGLIIDETKYKPKQGDVGANVELNTTVSPPPQQNDYTDNIFNELNDDDFITKRSSVKLKPKLTSITKTLKYFITETDKQISSTVKYKPLKRIQTPQNPFEENFYDELSLLTTFKPNTDLRKKFKIRNRQKKVRIINGNDENESNAKSKRRFKGLFWRN